MVFQLSADLVFPHPSLANEDGMLAVGGDLSTDRLLLAYQNGIFPWFNEDDPILWFSPAERCVIYPDRVAISKSMKTVLRSEKFNITTNKAFGEVIGQCAKIPRKDQDGTWITKDMQKAYIKLNRLGYAHSVEVWEAGALVGGLYGVLINRVFCGESMFSNVSNASKAALIWLCQNSTAKLIDCQLPNEHLLRMGAEMIGREEYIKVLGDIKA